MGRSLRKKYTISIIILAFNEEENLKSSVTLAINAIEQRISNYELIIIDDGSRDQTGIIADQLHTENERIRVVHHQNNKGLGSSYKEGIHLAAMGEMEYVGLLPGDANLNFTQENYKKLLDAVGKADIIVHVPTADPRTWFRRLTSMYFVKVLNIMFRLNYEYYNGANIYKRDLLKDITFVSGSGYFAFAELLIRVSNLGGSYVAVHIPPTEPNSNSKAVNLKNIISVIKGIIILWWNLKIIPLFTDCISTKSKKNS
ncbi:MAG: glycosyltransferase family 2 protein [Chloroflexi bacterium]|nr:glycosyltransferase family 2 protein [Chloroflexota bacterium]